MHVFKRDGRKEEVHFDKITSRIKKLCYELNMDFIDPVAITLKVISGLYSGVTTQELDNLAAEIAASMITVHADYAILAARIAISNLHKETRKQFSDVMDDLYNVKDNSLKKQTPMISKFYHEIIMENADRLNSAIIYDRDFGYDYFGFKTLEEAYLLKINGKTVERPQHMLMRISVGIHGRNIDSIIETYNLLSEKYFLFTPNVLLYAARSCAHLNSSYILSMSDDSIEGIYETLTRCALISKSSGEIGLNIHCIRGKGTYIAGTNGISNGLVPMLRVYNNTALLAKRKDTFTLYVEPWHTDILDFLNLKKSTGKYEMRAQDLNYALWIPDLFMRRVESNGDWSLMCPSKCPGLFDTWGHEFDELYEKYERENKFIQKIKAQDLWFQIIETQVETGMPYLLYKDTCNRKSNQQNLGTIRNGGHMAETIQYSSSNEAAVCSQASISLDMFVSNKIFDFNKLYTITKIVTRNLNKIIDINEYPNDECSESNLRNRPIGIGVQGLADAFILMRLPYESEEAQLLNQQIFETIYYAALDASCELAKEYGSPYETYTGCPVSNGQLQYDMWNKIPTTLWDWNCLKQKISEYGLRNSLLIAAMSTSGFASKILSNNNSFEPILTNVQTKNLGFGDFKIFNQHLVKDLSELDLWDDDMKTEIINLNGSIQAIDKIPDRIKELYKIVSEISLKTTLKMACDRGAFIDQSQSFNIYITGPNYGKLTSIHFSAWKMGLKTGLYQLKSANTTRHNNNGNIIVNGMINVKISSPTKSSPQPLTPTRLSNGQENVSPKDKNRAEMVCSLDNKDDCLMCGS